MKKNHLNKLSLVAASCLLLGLGSCKKYLDQTPITEVGADQVFKDVPSTYKALVGVYSRLMGDQMYGIRVSLYYTVDTDEMQGPTGAGDNDRRDIARYAATSGNAQINSPFNQMFQAIEYANICIENIPKMEMYNNGTEQEKKQLRRMHGEALTLRALFYFEAIRNWGDLPIHFEPAATKASMEPFPKREDRDVIYNRLLEDLKTAATLVPWKNEVTGIGDQADERITKAAVKGLRARIALFRGGYALRQDGTMKRNSDYLAYYQIAKEECADIMNSGQHNLNPSFKDLWKNQVGGRVANDPQGELIFQASAIGGGGAQDSKLGYYNGPRVNNLGNSSINPLPTYFYLFDSTDTRRDVTITPYFVAANGTTKIGQPITTLTDGKYRRDWINSPAIDPADRIQYFGLKWQILRYSDVLLMFAEAENELNGPTGAAYNAINTVRRRGYGKPLNTADATVDLIGLSKADFFKAIVRERSLELGGEGVRKYDLIRWNLLGTAIDETKTNLGRMGASTQQPILPPSYQLPPPPYSMTGALPASMYYRNNNAADDASLWANSFYRPAPSSTPSGTTRVNWVTTAIAASGTGSPLGRFATGFTPGKSELLPIPQPARDANFNLSQNPGY